MPNGEINIGGYDTYSFNDSDGVAILTLLLHKDRKIKVHFAEGDKTPNIDGWFELCTEGKKKQVPIGKIEVQIKTLERDYNDNRGKYCCNTKIFNYLKNGLTRNPVMLFLVDIKTQKVFYIHITHQYVLKLGDYRDDKTIYFGDENELTDTISFYEKAINIYNENEKAMSYDKKSSLQIDSDIDKVIISELQEVNDYFNKLFDTDLYFIKEQYYSDTWKFGLAYARKDNSRFSILGIYRLKRGRDGLLIKSFDMGDSSKYWIISSFIYDGSKSLYEMIDYIASETLHQYFKNDNSESLVGPKHFIHPKYLPDLVLAEWAFYFLDNISVYSKELQKPQYPHIYNKDEVPLSEFKRIWEAINRLSLEKSVEYSGREDIYVLYLDDPFNDARMTSDAKRFYEIFNGGNLKHFQVPFKIIKRGAYKFFEDMVIELEQRDIKTIKRIWKYSNYMNVFEEWGKGHGESGKNAWYTINDYYNICLLYNVLPAIYKESLKRLFGDGYNNYEIKKQYHMFVSRDTTKPDYEMAELSNGEFSIVQHNFYIDENNAVAYLEEKYPDARYEIGGLFELQEKTPLYTYLKLLVYKSICVKNSFKMKHLLPKLPLI